MKPKNKLYNRIMAHLLVPCLLIFSVFPMSAQAEDLLDSTLAAKIENDRQIELSMQDSLDDGYIDVDTHVPDSILDYKNYYPMEEVGLEASYDPRTISGLSSRMPQVRDQDALGTCWAHSAMFMIEMNLAARGQKNMASEDMSEYQLAYFGSHNWTDPLGNATNDRFYKINSGSTTLATKWYDGGNTVFTKYMMMDWLGAVSEKSETATAYQQLLNSVNQSSGSSSAYLSDEYAIKKDLAHVQDVTVLNLSDRDLIKTKIKEQGSIGTAYYSNSFFPWLLL